MTTMVVPIDAPAKAKTKITSKTTLKIAPKFRVAVHIDTEVLDPEVARRKANVWLLLYAGHLLRADNPELILEEGELLWRYDVLLTQISYGVVGKIASICVRAATGEVMADPTIRSEWLATARALLQQKGLPVLADEEYSYEDDQDVVNHAF